MEASKGHLHGLVGVYRGKPVTVVTVHGKA